MAAALGRGSAIFNTMGTRIFSSQVCVACRSQPLLRTKAAAAIAWNRRGFATKKPSPKKPARMPNPDHNPTKLFQKKPGKPTPGFERLYGKGSALGAQSQPKSQYQLSAAEKEALDDMVKLVQQYLTAEELAVFKSAYTNYCQSGTPKEFAELLPLVKQQSLDLTASARLIFLSNQIARRAQSGKDSKKSIPFSAPGYKHFEFRLDLTTFLLTTILSYFVYRALVPGEGSKEITWQEFKTAFLDKGLVDKLTVVNSKLVRVDLHREAVASMYPESPAQHSNFRYYFSIGSVEAFERKLDQAQQDLHIPSAERIPVTYKGETIWLSTLLSFGPTLLFLAGIFFISRRSTGGGGGGGLFGIGKSKAKKFNQDADVKVRFGDVAGMDEAKQEIMEFVSFLKEPGQYQRLGAKIPRGALLSGPPGTGKTMLAKATAGEAGVPFFSISGSEFVEIFVGVGASRVRDLFATARKSTPCIIFIDEIDAVGKARGKSNISGGNDEREGTLNQILTEMDGFNTSEQVVVLAGTNRPDVLDQALLRPGRFDRHIAIDRPTTEGRKQIFDVHLKTIVTRENIGFLTGRLAALTPGFSGADIANCVNEAALIAARTSAEVVLMTHFEQAIERTIGGLEKKSLVLNAEERKTVAYHEAGHAICGWYFKYADPLLKVSIIPRGKGALGYAQYLPAGDVYLMNVNQLMDRMAMALGGRVSEEIHFDTVTSGASDDFNKVTKMATSMVTKWGMSSIGHVYYDDDPQQSFQKPFSEDTAQRIDGEVRRIVEQAMTQCRDLLTAKKHEVGLVAEELLSKEVIGRDDMVRLLGKRPFEDNKEFTKYFDGAKSAPPPPPTEGGASVSV